MHDTRPACPTRSPPPPPSPRTRRLGSSVRYTSQSRPGLERSQARIAFLYPARSLVPSEANATESAAIGSSR